MLNVAYIGPGSTLNSYIGLENARLQLSVPLTGGLGGGDLGGGDGGILLGGGRGGGGDDGAVKGDPVQNNGCVVRVYTLGFTYYF